MMKPKSAALAVVAFARFAAALDNGVGHLPFMGFNTWNTFAADIDSDLILETAKVIQNSGLQSLGYEYIVIDDTWQETSRMANGTLMFNSTKFPDGMRNLTDQIHAMGFKTGIYSSAGRYTCGGFPASLGFETEDANSYAEWGFDLLKYDNCYNEGQSGNANISYARYEVMSKALNATGRPILYSLCQWGEDAPWDWASTIANTYRISGDIYPSFDRPDDRCPCQTYECTGVQGYHCSVTNIVEKSAPIGQKVRAGSFGDMDSLEVGVEGMSFTEQVAHMTMWAINKSPLVLGNDVRSMTNETVAIVSNKAIIAINQDSGTTPASRVFSKAVAATTDSTLPSWEVQPATKGNLQLWSGSLTDGDKYLVVLFNTSPQNLTYTLPLIEAFNSFDYGDVATKSLSGYDVWAPATSSSLPANATRAEIASVAYGAAMDGTICGSIPDIAIEAHGVRVFLLTESNSTCISATPAARRMMGRRAWSPELF